MPKRAVFDATDDQIERLETLGENPKNLGFLACRAFEEWLKRREGRANRAEFQKRKYLSTDN